MHPRLAPLAADIEHQRTALHHAVAHQPTGVLDAAPAPGAWSPAEILDHLATVELGVSRLLAKRLLRAKEAGLGQDASTEPVRSVRQEAYLTQTIEAPENVRPSVGVTSAVALGRLEASEGELRALLAEADGYDLCGVTARHQIFGELDMYEWLIFLARHEQRHVAQIARAITSLKGA